ncbi:predicted protein [Lichtheimia corymbifera JMRC:FSU:9682]|uniref:Yeast cell wall synthesis Kre9/Knh1-like N-terminal domain-containing protein n=1 Tax=Lichtheimia corymbifera JMRC:FSU:9682 TaxID=1263082 RepID=A0A068RHN0_9FUNG|nr:predicted protein [Lichtheimia corymbifera JMRC:FSU:9682]
MCVCDANAWIRRNQWYNSSVSVLYESGKVRIAKSEDQMMQKNVKGSGIVWHFDRTSSSTTTQSIIMKFTIAAIASTLLTVVSAQGTTGVLQVTNPTQNTEFTAGRVANITWQNPTVDKVQIELANGDANNLNHLFVIANDVDAKSGTYAWHIPDNTTAGTYALIFGTSPNVAYSPQFKIGAAGSGGDDQQEEGDDQQQGGDGQQQQGGSDQQQGEGEEEQAPQPNGDEPQENGQEEAGEGQENGVPAATAGDDEGTNENDNQEVGNEN